MTVSDRLDRAEKALTDAARQLVEAETREDVRRAEGLLCDAAKELREAEIEHALAVSADLRAQAKRAKGKT
jgi:hypothetical protein